MTKSLAVFIFMLLFSCTSKKENTAESDAKKPVIAVVNYPLFYFAKTIGGDMVKVHFPTIDGDPAYWKPNAKQVNDFQNADLILANGAGYEKWMEKVSLPSSKIVNTSIGFKDRWIEVNEGLAHSHGSEGKHVHQGTAFTTWLDFNMAAAQATSNYKAISGLLPGHSEELNKNFEHLQKDLGDLNKKMKEIGKNLEGQHLIASHPVYQYLEKGYGLKLTSVHWEPNELPTDDMWKDLEKTIAEDKVGIMIWEDEPLGEIRSKLEKLNVLISVFDPCANKPESGDFIEVMNANIERLAKLINLQ